MALGQVPGFQRSTCRNDLQWNHWQRPKMFLAHVDAGWLSAQQKLQRGQHPHQATLNTHSRWWPKNLLSVSSSPGRSTNKLGAGGELLRLAGTWDNMCLDDICTHCHQPCLSGDQNQRASPARTRPVLSLQHPHNITQNGVLS